MRKANVEVKIKHDKPPIPQRMIDDSIQEGWVFVAIKCPVEDLEAVAEMFERAEIEFKQVVLDGTEFGDVERLVQ